MRPSNSFIPIISSILEVKIKKNDKIPLTKKDISVFHSANVPGITISRYLDRITKYAKCSDYHFILALIYIDRLIEANPSFIISSLNIHRLLIASIVISLKYDSDYFYNNSIYARVGGISLKEMNSLEKEMLYKLDFNLYVSDEEFAFYHSELLKFASMPKTSA